MVRYSDPRLNFESSFEKITALDVNMTSTCDEVFDNNLNSNKNCLVICFIVNKQYGTMMALGTVDFYPGVSPYYGCFQPGCYDHLIDVVSCSHSRAHKLYSSSLIGADCLAWAKCSGDPHHIPHNCQPLHQNELSNEIYATVNDRLYDKSVTKGANMRSSIGMGYWIDTNLSGLFLVNVTGTLPYCV